MKEVRLEYPNDGRVYRMELRIKAGDKVRDGDCVAVIESDKATQEVDAVEAMRILRITPSARGYLLLIEELEMS